MPRSTSTPLVVLNPHASGGRCRRLAEPVARWLAQHAPQARLLVPEDGAAARDALLAAPEGSRIVVVGGDGTVQQLLPALLARHHVLGLVPCGSGNDGARALGLRGWHWSRALPHALAAAPRLKDIGELLADAAAPGSPAPVCFASSLCAGFDGAVSLRAAQGPRLLRGLPRYLLATLRELAALQPNTVHVKLDGLAVHEGPALFVSTLNTPSYGGGMPLAPGARTDDGRLDLAIAGRFGRLGTLAMLPRLLLGRHLGHPQVKLLQGRTVFVRAAEPMALAADGEPLPARLSFTVRVLPGALRVVGASAGGEA